MAVASALGPLVGSLMYSSPGTVVGVGPVSGGEMAPTSSTVSCNSAHRTQPRHIRLASEACTLVSFSALNHACEVGSSPLQQDDAKSSRCLLPTASAEAVSLNLESSI